MPVVMRIPARTLETRQFRSHARQDLSPPVDGRSHIRKPLGRTNRWEFETHLHPRELHGLATVPGRRWGFLAEAAPRWTILSQRQGRWTPRNYATNLSGGA